MSKKSKARGKEKRLKEKRSRKEQMQVQYQKWAEQGKNKKSKRSRRKALKSVKSIAKVNHSDGMCGNPGCIRCFGVKFRPFLRHGIPYRMPQWMYMKWCALTKDEKKKLK